MPTFALNGLLGGLTNGFASFDILHFLLLILVLCISLSIHEVSHGWIAYKLGDDTAYLAGRLTLNPLAHLDLVGSICFIIGGIGWAKPVPINPARFDRKYTMKRGIVLSSLAGPGSNLIMAIVSSIIYFIVLTIFSLTKVATIEIIAEYGKQYLIPDSTSFMANLLLKFLLMLISSNFILAIFNLLPVPPLDGFKIFGALLPNNIYFKIMNYERYIGMIFLFLVLFGGGVLSSILAVVSIPFNFAIFEPLQALFIWLWGNIGII